MTLSFEPLARLAGREIMRFVGTIGDMTQDSLGIYGEICSSFRARDSRTSRELEDVVLRSTSSEQRKMARNTIEVSASLGFIDAVALGHSRDRKYVLAEAGRVVNALSVHPEWAAYAPAALLRPMFEGHGDYLLQALACVETEPVRTEQIPLFTKRVRALAKSKLDEIPNDAEDSRWAPIRRQLQNRLLQLGAEAAAEVKRPTLEELQRKRRVELKRKLESRKRQENASGEGQEVHDPKTFEHQLARCLSWLLQLGLIRRRSRGVYELESSGRRVLSLLTEKCSQRTPLRIPPSLDLLQDCFRWTEAQAEETFGYVVDSSFWEALVLNSLPRSPSPEDTSITVIDFSSAFDSVQLPGIEEAWIDSLRQLLFHRSILEGSPRTPGSLEPLLTGEQSIVRLNPDKYSYGRNRQGRLAYVFRKGSRG